MIIIITIIITVTVSAAKVIIRILKTQDKNIVKVFW